MRAGIAPRYYLVLSVILNCSKPKRSLNQSAPLTKRKLPAKTPFLFPKPSPMIEIPAIDLIVIAGAPGSGKTAVSDLLHAALRSPYIDFGDLRNFHLDREWSNQSAEEEQMSF